MKQLCSLLSECNAATRYPVRIHLILQRTAKRIACSTWMLMIPFTSATGYFLGPFSEVIVVGVDWVQTTQNWSLAVADSGNGKSQACRKLSKVVDAVEEVINEEMKKHLLEKLNPDGDWDEDCEDYKSLMQNTVWLRIRIDGAVSSFDIRLYYSCLKLSKSVLPSCLT